MPKLVKKYSVLISSPSDLEDERDAVENAIEEISKSMRRADVYFEPRRWEVDAIPGVGLTGQDVINTQLVDDADILIVMFGAKAGTPVDGYESGTIAEFERVYAQLESGRFGRIFVYFSDAAVPPSQIDPLQLMEVKKFKKSLADRGVLYAEFTEAEELAMRVRLALTDLVMSQEKKEGNEYSHEKAPEKKTITAETSTIPSSDSVVASDVEAASEEPDEFLDVRVSYEENAARVGKKLNEIAGMMTRNTERTQANLDKMESAMQLGPISASAGRTLVDESASSLEDYAQEGARLFAEANKLLLLTLGDLVKSVELQAADTGASVEPETLEAVSELSQAIEQSKQSMQNYADSLQRMPRLTKRFRAARARALAVTLEFTEFLGTQVRACEEVYSTLVKYSRPQQLT